MNPYAADENPIENNNLEYAPVQPEYAQLAEDEAYIGALGWAPKLRTGTRSIPSIQRLGNFPTIDLRPTPDQPVVEEWRHRDADTAQRHGIEDVTSTGWNTRSGVSPGERRFAPDPRSTPAPESRITSRLSPSSYRFTRYFDQFNRTSGDDPLTGSARTFNGIHFSMADHRRDYDIEGFAPVRRPRNTYRIEPQPWDVHIGDMPPTDVNYPNDQAIGVEVPAPSRSWRLM